MNTMQLEIISRETIKPSSATPHHLRSHKLSLLDQVIPRIYVPIVLFYHNNDRDQSISPDYIAERSASLKKSLSEILSQYYPFAGRIKDKASIECNDEGVDFYQARIHCKLSEILKCPEIKSLNLFFPGGVQWNESDKAGVLVVQISYFDCGGMAVCLCMSHKLGDAASITSFLNDWAAQARGEQVLAKPEFNIAASLFPARDQLAWPDGKSTEKAYYSTKRFVFDASKLAELKALATRSGIVQMPTRVELVSALILKCAIAASSAKSGRLLPSAFIQTVNLRTRMIPPLPDNSIGNLLFFLAISTTTKDESEIEYDALVKKLREGMTHFKNTLAINLRGEKLFPFVCESLIATKDFIEMNTNMNAYRCSSWCRFPMYQADFGWGGPIWISSDVTTAFNKNTIILMDTRRKGGIEALVTLEQAEMSLFERDQELLAFASYNPSAFDTDVQMEHI